MQTYKNQEEINIFEIIDLLRRNLIFIIWSLVISLFIALLLSGISFFLNRDVATYSLTTNISLSDSELSDQIVTMINNSLSHPNTLLQAENKLEIDNSNYSVIAKRGDDVGILQLIVEGPDSAQLTGLSNEILSYGKPLIETVFPMVELRKLGISTLVLVPQSTQPIVNWVLNSVLGIMLGGMISVFYIFVIYYMSPNIVKDNELESLFNSKILGRFVGKPKKQTLRKFFEVR